MNMFAYHILSICLFHFYNNGHLAMLKPFESWYSRIWAEAGGTVDRITGGAIDPSCESMAEAVLDYKSKWLIDYFCRDETVEWRILSTAYHGLFFVLSTVLCGTVGFHILTFCD
jgi:hypothetical protein